MDGKKREGTACSENIEGENFQGHFRGDFKKGIPMRQKGFKVKF
jgi:hypothetical protein